MATRVERPIFLGGKGGRAKHQSLLQQDGCNIMKRGNSTTLTLWTGEWTAAHTELVRRYKVNSVSVHDPAFGERKTSDFLIDLPVLKRVAITIWTPVDFSGLARLAELRSLRIHFGLGGWRLGDRIQWVDLSGLTKLEDADIMMCKAFESILKCRKIKVLTVRNECDHRLRDLDLSNLAALRELQLDHCPKLRKVLLHPKAKVPALAVALCGSYKIDWQRMGADLIYLLVGGRLTFPLEDVLNAPNLEELHLYEIRRLPPLGFLRRLKKAASGGRLFSTAGTEILR